MISPDFFFVFVTIQISEFLSYLKDVHTVYRTLLTAFQNCTFCFTFLSTKCFVSYISSNHADDNNISNCNPPPKWPIFLYCVGWGVKLYSLALSNCKIDFTTTQIHLYLRILSTSANKKMPRHRTHVVSMPCEMQNFLQSELNCAVIIIIMVGWRS